MKDEEAGLELEYLESLRLFNTRFEYKGKSYSYKDVAHIQFTATVTQHSVNFVPTGKSYDVDLYIYFVGGNRISIDQERRLINLNKKERFEAVMRAANILMDITFNQRVQQYEEQMVEKGFVDFGKHQISRNGDLFRGHELRLNIMDGDIEFQLSPFQVECVKKKPSIGERLKQWWSGPTEVIDISVDKDCFLYVMKEYLGLSWRNQPVPRKRESGHELFNRSLLILGAQIAKADGKVTSDEISKFKSFFGIDEHSFPGAGRIFVEAASNPKDVRAIAQDILNLFNGKNEPLEYIVVGLFQIAAADGHIDQSEIKIIRDVGGVFGFSTEEISRLHTIFSEATSQSNLNASSSGDLYIKYLKVLGLKDGASLMEIKTAYKGLARNHHPDLLRAQGVPIDDIKHAEDVLKVINTAYDWLSKNHPESRGAGLG